MREHRALRRAGGPGGIADDRGVVGGAPAELEVEVPGVGRVELLCLLGQLGQAHEPGLAVAAQAARIVVDQVLQVTAAGPDTQELVDLLLILDDREPRLGVLDDVLHLALDGVLIDRHGDAAERLRRHHRPVELRAVVADDRHAVAAREAERGEAERDEARLLEILGPRGRLPDAEIFLADRDLVGEAPRILAHELGKRVVVRDCLQFASAISQGLLPRGRADPSGPMPARAPARRPAPGGASLAEAWRLCQEIAGITRTYATRVPWWNAARAPAPPLGRRPRSTAGRSTR